MGNWSKSFFSPATRQNHRKKSLAGVVAIAIVAAMALFATMASVAFASSTAAHVGTWFVADKGPGAWAGGTLLADGTATGSGEFAFPVAQGQEEVANIQGNSWSFTDASQTTVNLCVLVTGVQGPVFPIGVPILACIQVPVTGPGAPATIFGGDTLAKVQFQH